jgi:hypothetical protein
MTKQSWKDSEKYGSMARAALWLEEEVGEGEVFTKAALRAAFPDVAQIDRRIRELRKYGWQIDTSREDPALKQQEQRYVKKGLPVWIPGQAKAQEKASLTAAQRTAIMQKDGYLCRCCGVGAGEAFAGGGQPAQLDISRRKVRNAEGVAEIQPVTECNRCRVGRRTHEVDFADVLDRLSQLTELERKVFSDWVAQDYRQRSVLEEIWGLYRVLPADSREEVARVCAELTEEDQED